MQKKNRRNLSNRESIILAKLSYENKSIFTVKDLENFVKDTKNFLHHLIEKKWILKICRGVYAITPLNAGEKGSENYTLHSFVIGSQLASPYYIGYLSALNYHGLTDRTPSHVYIATTTAKRSRKLLDIKFRFVTMYPEKIFGIEKKIIEEKQVNISSPEKTIVDCLNHPQYGGGMEEITKTLFFSKNEINVETLIDYSKKMKNNTIIKRLGYISDVIGWDESLELLCNIKLKNSYSFFEPKVSKNTRSRIKEKWKLIVNTELDLKRITQ